LVIDWIMKEFILLLHFANKFLIYSRKSVAANFIVIEHPCMIYLVHDSIVTTSDIEKFIETIMNEELTKHSGILSKLKFDYWVQEN